MRILRLRNKLLLSVVAVSIVVALASMLAVSFVVRQQHLDQSNALLQKASRIINDSLDERKENQLIATRRLATQTNLGSTIWYLAQYAQSDIDRETLFATYLQLVMDTYKLGRTGRFVKTAIYDASGNLVSFAVLDHSDEMVGFVDRYPQPVFRVSSLKNGDEVSRKSLISSVAVAKIKMNFGAPIPKQESVHYAVVDGYLAIESQVPILDLAFDATTGKQEMKQLGFLVSVQALDQLFVDQLTRLTDTKINIFTPLGYSVGNLRSYHVPDWNDVQKTTPVKITEMGFNEIVVDGVGFYQSLIPLVANQQVTGTIVALQSKEIVQKNTWQMIRILALIALACLLLILPFAWYFTNSIAQPLATLGRVFRGVASGKNVDSMYDELNELAKVGPENELGDLTQSFMMMVDTVKQKIEQINDINASLEKRIEESTAQLRTANAELGHLANIDALTNLCNRRSFFEIANLEAVQTKRSKRALTLIMLDVDNFKSINDRFGHPVGDEVLRQIGNCLAGTARESDTPARCGGEEFVILAPDTDLIDGVVLAERMRTALKAISIKVDFQVINPTASVGVACLRQDETFEQLFARADAAMYLAKNAGRDRVIESI